VKVKAKDFVIWNGSSKHVLEPLLTFRQRMAIAFGLRPVRVTVVADNASALAIYVEVPFSTVERSVPAEAAKPTEAKP
jgi:hypothetical protein